MSEGLSAWERDLSYTVRQTVCEDLEGHHSLLWACWGTQRQRVRLVLAVRASEGEDSRQPGRDLFGDRF